LRDDEAIEWIVPDEFGEFADGLGVRGRDAEQFQALLGEPLAEVSRHGQLADWTSGSHLWVPKTYARGCR
jgi:hypothetical protein